MPEGGNEFEESKGEEIKKFILDCVESLKKDK
jgi:hypothetical protein